MNNDPTFDPSIPVLTEVFQETLSAPHAEEPTPPPAAPDPVARLEARAVDHWTEPEWTLMERRLSERVLTQLQNRVDFVLEQRLRDSLEEVLRQSVADLTAEIRKGLHRTIEQIVVRAVAQEIAHLHALKK
jgi:hypothetical protein